MDDMAADLELNRILWRDWYLDFAEQLERRFGIELDAASALSESRRFGEFVQILSRMVENEQTSAGDPRD